MLIFHIVAGSFLLLFGLLALSTKKGQKLHRHFGNLFFISLILMAASAAFLPDGAMMGLHSTYYAVTAWAIVLRPEKTSGLFDIFAMLVIVAISVMLFYGAYTIDKWYAYIFYVLGTVAAISAALDLNMILRGGHSGKHRIARHAWRTCYALLGAVMSFTSNTVEYWPSYIDSNTLIYLVIAVMFYWVFRILFTAWYNKTKNVLGNRLFLKSVFGR